MEDKITKSTLTEEQIEKFKKLEEEAFNNTDESGYYMDEFDYCLGNLAEDLCSAGEKEWARKIYKEAEGYVDGVAEGCVDREELADSIIENLSDKEWAKKIQENQAKV